MGKYEEALERAKSFVKRGGEYDRQVMESIFPELKESEDERIRKTLIHIVKGACDKYGIKYKGDDITEEKLLAYLEKQKEQKWSPSEGEMRVLYKLCYISNQITDEDDTDLTRLYQDLKREYFNGHSFENMFSREKQKDEAQKQFNLGMQAGREEVLYEMEKEQKPVAQTEKEKQYVKTLKNLVDKHFETTNGFDKAYYDHIKEWLDGYHVEQKPAEWSEEDENWSKYLLDELYAGLVDYCGAAEKDMRKAIKWFETRIKFLRPQPHWKPSEEQMKALNNIILQGEITYVNQTQELISLKDDLKKL